MIGHWWTMTGRKKEKARRGIGSRRARCGRRGARRARAGWLARKPLPLKRGFALDRQRRERRRARWRVEETMTERKRDLARAEDAWMVDCSKKFKALTTGHVNVCSSTIFSEVQSA